MKANRSNEIMKISSKWMDIHIALDLNTRGCWYLYNLSCGWGLSDKKFEYLMIWFNLLEQKKEEVKIVKIYLDTCRM